MYSALQLAKYIVSKCIEDKHPISNLQLQKILYFVQREFLQKRGHSAFKDDIEAWRFGPVVPEVYYYFCGFGAMPISHLYGTHKIESADAPLIDGIIESRRSQRPWDLVNETHRPGSAWDQTYRNGDRGIIPVDLIRDEG